MKAPWILCALLLGCGQQGSFEQEPVMRVVESGDARGAGLGSASRPIPLHLNSKISLWFTQDIDKLSVTADTVRLVKVTPAGPERVVLAGRVVGARSITLEPEVPRSATLDDGSFQLDQLYRLEVAGFPLTNTVCSAAGAPVEDHFIRYYKTVARDADPGPLLPVGVPNHPFALKAPSLRMASSMRTVLLHFTLPVDPVSLSVDSFQVLQAEASEPLEIESVRLVRPRRRGEIPGTIVELRIHAKAPLRENRQFWIDLKPAGAEAAWIRDYRGRALTQTQTQVPGWVFAGGNVELVRFDGEGEPRMQRRSPEELGFECRQGRIQVLARREVGLGSLGVFQPAASMHLCPGQPFDRGDGTIQVSGSRFQFSEIHIPQGVRVTVHGSKNTPVELLSTGSIQIDGELVFETEQGAAAQTPFETSDTYARRLIESQFGCRVVAADRLEVRGAIRHARLPEDQVVLLARELVLHGGIPSQAVRAHEPGRVSTGVVQTGTPVAYAMQPGYPAGHRTTAAAWTPWQRLPEDFDGGALLARVDGVVGEVEVFIQIAEPDSIDPSRPYRDPAAGFAQPRKLPLSQPIEVTGRPHVRFCLEAKVIGGRDRLPSVESLVVLGR